MARDRKRAKQRQQRRAQQRAAVRPSNPRRQNVPGPLEHASGEADEFDARLVAAAEEQAADPGLDERAAGDGWGDGGGAAMADEALPPADDSLAPLDEAESEAEELGAPESGERTGALSPAAATAPSGRREGSRVAGFLRASWSELQRVQWPDRRQVAQATAVVLGFVVIAGAFLGLAYVVAQQIVELIL